MGVVLSRWVGEHMGAKGWRGVGGGRWGGVGGGGLGRGWGCFIEMGGRTYGGKTGGWRGGGEDGMSGESR